MRSKWNNGLWTQSRFNSFIKSALRSASVKWPARYGVLNASFVEQKINPESGRLAKFYACNKCKGHFTAKNVEVNHIEPVVPVSGMDSWDNVIERMFCEAEGMETLCKPCHRAVTKEENNKRKGINVSK